MALSSVTDPVDSGFVDIPAASEPDLIPVPPGAVSREGVVRATQHLLAERGLGISMDDIAAAAGVSRRSLFRHFDSREALVAEALERSLNWYFERVAEQADTDLSLDEWLTALARNIHRLQIDAGRAIWQLAAANDDDLTESLARVNRLRRNNGVRFSSRVAGQAWRLAGGEGDPPDAVLDAFVFTLSSYATRATVTDRQISLERTATSAGAILSATIRADVHPAPKSASRTR